MFARVGSGKSRNVLVELVLIVLGISIALWFEGLEDAREQASALLENINAEILE